MLHTQNRLILIPFIFCWKGGSDFLSPSTLKLLLNCIESQVDASPITIILKFSRL